MQCGLNKARYIGSSTPFHKINCRLGTHFSPVQHRRQVIRLFLGQALRGGLSAPPSEAPAEESDAAEGQPEAAAPAANVEGDAVAAEEEAEAPAEKAIPESPLASSGDPHLLALVIPRGDVSDVLVFIRREVLAEMEDFAQRTQAETKEWSSIEVEELTEELDENLRKHRPRAGYAPAPGPFYHLP